MLHEVTELLKGFAVGSYTGFFTDVLNTEDSNGTERYRIIPFLVFQMLRKNKYGWKQKIGKTMVVIICSAIFLQKNRYCPSTTFLDSHGTAARFLLKKDEMKILSLQIDSYPPNLSEWEQDNCQETFLFNDGFL